MSVPASGLRALRAYGLDWRTTLALPGTRPVDDDRHPAGTVEVARVDAIDFAPEGEAARGRTGDGRPWIVERGAAGDLRMRCTGLVDFHLDAGATRLGCLPADAGDPAWTKVLLGAAMSTVALARGAVGLHAATVQVADGVVALAGRSGAGKSTLAAELLARGGTLVADDVTLLRADGGGVLAEPGPPILTVPAARAGRLGEVIATLGDERLVDVGSAVPGPVAPSLVVLLDREAAAGSAPGIEEVPDALAELVPHAVPVADGAAGAEVVSALWALVESAAVVRLRAAADTPPERLAELIERRLAG